MALAHHLSQPLVHHSLLSITVDIGESRYLHCHPNHATHNNYVKLTSVLCHPGIKLSPLLVGSYSSILYCKFQPVENNHYQFPLSASVPAPVHSSFSQFQQQPLGPLKRHNQMIGSTIPHNKFIKIFSPTQTSDF